MGKRDENRGVREEGRRGMGEGEGVKGAVAYPEGCLGTCT